MVYGDDPKKSVAISADGSGTLACLGTDQHREYCCPTNDLPTCTWRGTAPLCRHAKCKSGEVEITSGLNGDGKECWFNHKVLCCQSKASDAALSACRESKVTAIKATTSANWSSEWEGSAPFCKRGCDKGRQELTYSGWGAGGEEPCSTGSKSLCCTQPPPYQNCQWYKHGDSFGNFGNPFSCSGKCPAGKQMIASDIGSCFVGYQVYCCDAPASKSQTLQGLHKTYLQT